MVFNTPTTVEELNLETSVTSCDLEVNSVEDLTFDQDLFEVKETPGKGQGMIATQDILPGTIILREEPLVVMPDRIFQMEDFDYMEEWLEKRLLKLDSKKRQQFFDLADSRSDTEEKTILGIFFTNDMNFIDESAALFPMMARVNHACCPNADFITREKLGVQDLVATRLIKKDQEIFISYLPACAEGSEVRKSRQEYTQEWYGFKCNCSECILKKNEGSRSKVSKTHAKGLEDLDLEDYSNLIENLIQIHCKLPYQNKICQAGFEKSLKFGNWKKATQFFAAGYLNDSILNGDKDQNKWNFVINSTPVMINNEIYLFPN